MGESNALLKWARQLNSRMPFCRALVRRTACRKLADSRAAEAVPFLVSALASGDGAIRRIAEDGLKSLETPEAIDALFRGYLVTRDDAVRQVLRALGRAVPDSAALSELPASEPANGASIAESVWQFRNSRDGTVLGLVPEGDFLAGEERIRIHLPPYYLGIACVTNAQYAQFLTERRPKAAQLAQWANLAQSSAICREGDVYRVDPGKADLPVIWVTWEGASAYCRWARLRLPGELEWEKGARGTDGRLYPWGDEWEDGRPRGAGGEERKPEEITSVWAYPTARSPYGFYQMVGNVYEWCADWYEEKAYQRYAKGDLRPPRRGEHRLLRGGPWRFGTPVHLRTEFRKGTVWRAGTPTCGFRCAKSL